MKTVGFCTLRCKVNQYETEAMIELFRESGYKINDFEGICDIYVINTCTVTGTGDKKSRQMIRRACTLNPNGIIVVAGCYSQVSPKEVEKIQGVSLVIGTNEKNNIVKLVEKYCNENNRQSVSCVGDIMKTRQYENMWITSYDSRARAFVKIEDGCNEFCTYCIIPYARGPIRSRKLSDIEKEVTTLSKNGFKEVVLTGIHIASYGKDTKDVSLIDVIRTVNKIDGIERIRLGSIEPRILTEDFISEISKMKKMCGHFHISLQSGCDETLKRMNRKYTTLEYFECVKNLRKYFDNPAITTDIMVGFPGETDDEFNQSISFMERVQFSEAHVFSYSNRKGTKADVMPNQIPKAIKEERNKKMSSLCKKMHEEYLDSFVGKVMPVLFERKINEDVYDGHLANYIQIMCKSKIDLTHKIVNVKITSHKNGIAYGEAQI